MKIAQVSTPFIAVPPRDYGGIELVVANLTEGLTKKGHDITLFAPGNSKTSAKLVAPYPFELNKTENEKLFSELALKLSWMGSFPSLYHEIQAFEKAQEFDIIHNHFHYFGLFFGALVKTPVVHTYHGDLSSAQNSPIEAMILEKYKDANWIAISETQKNNCKIPLNFVAVIHHGIPIEHFIYEEKPEDYLVWLGRITPKKGVKDAVRVAKETNHKLIICGVVNPRDEEFFEKEIKPEIDNEKICFMGGVGLAEKVKLYAHARALLYPVTWEEPFGLVMIEAMGCGTPAIAYARGAVTEVVQDVETGFLINASENQKRGDYEIKTYGYDGLKEAVEKIYSMPDIQYQALRRQARNRVEKNFTLDVMIAKHEQVYEKIKNK